MENTIKNFIEGSGGGQVNQILVDLTDVFGYNESSEQIEAFHIAEDKLENLISSRQISLIKMIVGEPLLL